MNILIDIGHPATVHFFRNFIRIMKSRGHKIIVTAVEKDITYNLLEKYDIDYIELGQASKSNFVKILNWWFRVFNLVKIGYKKNIDIFLDSGGTYQAFAAFFLRKQSIIIDNTDASKINFIPRMLANSSITPVSFYRKKVKNQIYCEFFHGLAFLHPNYFTPNPEIYTKLGLKPGEIYILLRFVNWDAGDDTGLSAFTHRDIENTVKVFSEYGKVFISSEYDMPEHLNKIRIENMNSIKLGDMQDIEYYATLFYGESGAMASECAILGVPAFYISSKRLGFINELNEKYGLVFEYRKIDDSLEKARSLLSDATLAERFKNKRNKMLKDKLNFTDFMVWFIENYPQSAKEMKEKPNEIQKRFK